jgi:outer membrane lipoprotein-sorting protein
MNAEVDLPEQTNHTFDVEGFSDGDAVYTITCEVGKSYSPNSRERKISAAKQNPECLRLPIGTRAFFDQLETSGSIEFAGTDLVEDDLLYVFETAQSGDKPDLPIIMDRLYFRVRDGVLVKRVIGADRVASTTTFYDEVELNLPIPAEEFNMVLPAGVDVEDRTVEATSANRS